MIRAFRTHRWQWVCAGLLIFGGRELVAQTAADRSKDEAAVRQASKDYLAKSAQGDAKAIADCWLPKGAYTDLSGRTVKVQELLSADGGWKGGATASAAGLNATLRFVGSDVAVEEGEFYLPAGDDELAEKAMYTALWVRDAGRWKLDSVSERPLPAADNSAEVASLDAFVGDWSAEQNHIAIRISANWDVNKKFLSRRISLTAGKAEQEGTQTIGWDPLSGQIRSWMFCDDGSYSEGVWSLEGNAWMAASIRGMPDGTKSEATQIYKFPDKDTMVWKMIRGRVNGEPTDDVEVVLKRTAGKK